MSHTVRAGIAIVMLAVALVFLGLGVLELLEQEDAVNKSGRYLFFSLAAICAGAAAGVAFA